MAQPYLSIIIPAYNEEDRLPFTLIELDKYLSTARYSCEILVINDGSSDNTAKIAKKFSETIKNLKVVDNEENKGKGAAVRQGMLLAGGKLRMFIDADGAVDPRDIGNALQYFSADNDSESGNDIVIGSRLLGRKWFKPQLPFLRYAAERFSELLLRTFLKTGVSDHACGFKIFSEGAVEKILPDVKIADWGFDLETLALAQKFGHRIKEVAVAWRHDDRKEMPYSAYLQKIASAFKIRWWLWKDKYGIKES